jgi:hypothetical protein
VTPHDDADPIEQDPTGMRALLGSLPDPGPMPEGLVARIAAALEDEAAAAGGVGDRADRTGSVEGPTADGLGWAASAPPDASRPVLAEVVPLRRRRLWVVAGAAAAAVVVLGIGGLVLQNLVPDGLQATLGLTTEGAADSAAGAASAPTTRPVGVTLVAADEAQRVRVVGFDGDVASAHLAGVAAGLVVPPYSDFAGSPAVTSDTALASGAVADPAGARACATALGVRPTSEVVLQVGTVDGRPAAVLVATDPDGTRTAWVVGRGCSAHDPQVVTGPVAVG